MNINNPSLSQPLFCDKCKKKYYDYNNDGSENFTEIFSDGQDDYCIDCFLHCNNISNSINFKKISVYERIGVYNLNSGFIEQFLEDINLNSLNINNEEKNIPPKSLKTDSKVYTYALRLYKDINELSNDEFNEFKQFLIDSNLPQFNIINTFKIGIHNIINNDVISLNIVKENFMFLISISRDGTIGAFESYGLSEKNIIPDEFIEPLKSIDVSNIKPDNLLD